MIEVVTQREPPRRKVWETIGERRMRVVGPYRMGFEIVPAGAGSQLLVFIDHDEPSGPGRLAGKLLGGAYARRCARSMERP